MTNLAAVTALTAQQANVYLAGYGQPVPRAVAQRKKMIRVQIGCV